MMVLPAGLAALPGVAALAGLSGLALAATPEQETLIEALVAAHGLDPAQAAQVRAVVDRNPLIGTGHPANTRHPMTPAQCEERRAAAGLASHQPALEARCGRPWMAPLYDPAHQTAAEAAQCIDQYEFPGMPCAYPWTQVKAAEAAELCAAMGKRLCDAHEWEGACEGALLPPDYRWDLARGAGSPVDAVKRMRAAHNASAGKSKRWATGAEPPARGTCAMASTKTEGCDGGNPARCGTNTYPTGAFPGCVSPLGVYDQHGNAAEHMNLPLAPDQLAQAATGTLGVTEMKGSWFIWESYRAHEDWCRWRAPYWHGSRVQAADSHRNYHLGFRCCAEAVTP